MRFLIALFLVLREDLIIWMTIALQSWHTVISMPFSFSALRSVLLSVVERDILLRLSLTVEDGDAGGRDKAPSL